MHKARRIPPLQWQPPLARTRRRYRRPIFAWGGLGLTLLATAALLNQGIQPVPRIVWNASASAPIGLWRVQPGKPIHTGDAVLAHTPDSVRGLAARRRYIPANVPLLKRVVARSGDRVCARGNAIYIDGRRAAVRYAVDPHGRPLPWWRGCGRLRIGQFFLLMPAPDSFDSRYFGPVDQDAIIGRATPLWTR